MYIHFASLREPCFYSSVLRILLTSCKVEHDKQSRMGFLELRGTAACLVAKIYVLQ